MVEWY